MSNEFGVRIIDREEVISTLEGIVQGKEDFVYYSFEGCTYQSGGQPDCLIGHALSRWGVSGETLLSLDNCSGGDTGIAASEVLKLIREEELIAFTADAVTAMDLAQRAQDADETWGYALRKAKGEI